MEHEYIQHVNTGPPTTSLTITLNFLVIRSKILSSIHYFSNEILNVNLHTFLRTLHTDIIPSHGAVIALEVRSDRKQTDLTEKIYCLIDINVNNVNTATLRTWDWGYWSAESGGAAHCCQCPC